jgi:type I restriction enzyme R subunit
VAGVRARAAFDENLTHYKQQIPAVFWFNALLIASNGTDCRVGSLAADWERLRTGLQMAHGERQFPGCRVMRRGQR